jgi:hypothetical protein
MCIPLIRASNCFESIVILSFLNLLMSTVVYSAGSSSAITCIRVVVIFIFLLSISICTLYLYRHWYSLITLVLFIV